MVNGQVLHVARREEKKPKNGGPKIEHDPTEEAALQKIARWGATEPHHLENARIHFPEENVILAILERSLLDLNSLSVKEREVAKKAREWIIGPHKKGNRYSFPECCGCFDIPPLSVVARLVDNGTFSIEDFEKAKKHLKALDSSPPLKQHKATSASSASSASLTNSLTKVASRLSIHLSQIEEQNNIALFAVPNLTYQQGRTLLEVYEHAAFPRRLTVFYNEAPSIEQPSCGERYGDMLLVPVSQIKRTLQSRFTPSCSEAVFLPESFLNEANNVIRGTRSKSKSSLREQVIILDGKK